MTAPLHEDAATWERETQLEAIAEGAVNDGTSFYNPREVVKEAVLEQVKKAW